MPNASLGSERQSPIPSPAARQSPPASAEQGHGKGRTYLLPPHLARFGRREGQPLPETVQRKMESSFGASLSDVRIHEGPEAESIGAVAFTHGSNIYFAPGKYQPTSPAGQLLLRHELTHVMQQRSGKVTNPWGYGTAVIHDDDLEAEADYMAERETARWRGASLPAPTSSVPSSTVQPLFSWLPGSQYLGSASWYWRSATVGLGGVGLALGGPLGFAAGFSAPYAYDAYQWYQAQRYSTAHGGGPAAPGYAYHTVDRHGAWYHPQNIRRRALGGQQMLNWAGGAVPNANTSSQFVSSRWHNYARAKAIEHLLQIVPAANFTNAPIPGNQQFAPNRRRFTIHYPGWTTGWSYTALQQYGTRCSYVLSTFVSTAAAPNTFYLVQLFPTPNALGAVANTVVWFVPPL